MKKIIPILLALLVCLTGCSSGYDPNGNITLKYENGVYTYKGKTLTCSEYRGYEASFDTRDSAGFVYSMMLDTAKDVTNISWNTQSILEENMDKYKGCFSFQEYLGSQTTMAKSLGNDYWAVIRGQGSGGNYNMVQVNMYNNIESTPLTNGQVYVKYDGFTFGSEYDSVIVRPDCALITGLIKVSAGSYNTTDTVSVVQGKKEYQLQHGASQKYDYYVYNGMLIQIAKGLDLSSYIKFD